MQPSWVNRFAYPLHERIMNRRTFALVRELERSQFWSADRLDAFRNERLGRLIRHAYAHCPFWRDRMQTLRLRPSDIRCVRDLERLPPVTREDVDRHRERMSSRAAVGRTLMFQTSGTTDRELSYYWDRERQAWDMACRFRSQQWFGVTAGDQMVYLWPVEDCFTSRANLASRLRRFRDTCVNDSVIDVEDVWNGTAGRAVEFLKRVGPTCLYGYPSCLALLADYLVREGQSGGIDVRRVFVTGEPLFEAQGGRIRRAFGAPIVGEYGQQETGLIAYQCPLGRWHEMSETIILEWMTEGRQSRPGELGEIVATHLHTFTMPVIRYRTGDMSVAPDPADEVCSCGRGLRVIGAEPGGRSPTYRRHSDHFRGVDGVIEPDRVVSHLADVAPPETYEIRQLVNGSVRLHLREDVAQDSYTAQALVLRLRSWMPSDSHITVMPLRRRRNTGGKHRPVAQDVGSPGAPGRSLRPRIRDSRLDLPRGLCRGAMAIGSG